MRIPVFAILIAVLAVVAGASPARAGVYVAETLDGPGTGVRSFGGVDMARDGTGGLVYLRDDAGVPHVYLSRFYDGRWQPPERIDVGVESAATQAAVAAGDGHRLVVVFLSGGKLYGSVAPGGPPAPLPAPTLLYADPDPLKSVQDVAVDLGINGAGYAAFTVPGAGGTDVRATRLEQAAWTPVGPPLDIDVNRGARRPDVAVSAEGNAVVTWEEILQGGQPRIFARRVTGTALSVAPQEVSVGDLAGTPAGAADSADIDIEDDGSYAWVAFRQDVGGTSRVLARRLVGSLFDPAVPIDASGPAVHPRIDINGRGVGVAFSAQPGSNAMLGALLELDLFKDATRVDLTQNGSPPVPAVAFSERRRATVVWRHDGGSLLARYKEDQEPWEPEITFSSAAYGPVVPGQYGVAADTSGNMAIAFLQGDGADRRLVTGAYDRPPGAPIPSNSSNFRDESRPLMKWRPGSERWGPVTYRIYIGGLLAGETAATEFQLLGDLPDGTHRYQLAAIDVRGQETRSRIRYLRIDSSEPVVDVRIRGKRRVGRPLRFIVDAEDEGDSGLESVRVSFGDRSGATSVRRTTHRYARPGRYRVRVRAVDRADNVARLVVPVRIRK